MYNPIKKDLRELVTEMVVQAWCVPPNTAKQMDCDLAQAIIESLIPRIVAAVEQAHAEAIQSAANLCMNGLDYRESWHVRSDILALTPRLVQIEAKLRIAVARLADNEKWHDRVMGPRCEHKTEPLAWECGQVLNIRIQIATLERELEAERKGI